MSEARKYDRFQRNSGLYTCGMCGKRTRDTGNGEASAGLCTWCYLTESYYNEVVDGATSYADFLKNIEPLQKKYKRVWTLDRDWAGKANEASRSA